jgi:potassium-transporting ATPase KdpC subunit
MFTEIRAALRPAISLLLFLTLITGIAYPLAMTAIAQALYPSQANGSLIRDGGILIGSELIGQGFAEAGYFHPRPSMAGRGYDASASAASNLAPGSRDLKERIARDVAALRADGLTRVVPADLVTASASGLDPHISPEAAFVQVNRVAATRGLAPDVVRGLVVRQSDDPLLGFIGEPRVNVLLLNRQLDRISANKTP